MACAKLGCVMSSRATLAKRRADVSAMFDGVARRYDLMNSVMTAGTDRMWRREVLAAIDPQPGQLILDLAAGTGTSSVPLREAGAEVFPTDLSLGMLTEGRRRYPQLQFVAGDALDLPYADDSFDTVTISYGLRNVEDTLGALQEMLRVTKPGGQLLVNEFSTPTSGAFDTVYRRYLLRAIPTMANRLASNPQAYNYLAESIIAWPGQRELADLIFEAGWRAVGWKNLTGGIVALHRGWKP